MNFRKLHEIVAGVRRYQQSETPFKDLGWHGWFHAYSAASSYVNDEGESSYKIDVFAEHFNGKPLEEITKRLQAFGFPKLTFTIIFQDYVLPKGAEGAHERQLHIIRLKKDLEPKRMLHNIAHEWAHTFWWSLPKEDKRSFTNYYFLSFSQDTNLDTYALSGGPGEKFCELIAEAVTNPGTLNKEELKLVKMIASRNMPKFKLSEDGDLNAYSISVSNDQSRPIRIKEPTSKKIDKKFGIHHRRQSIPKILVAEAVDWTKEEVPPEPGTIKIPPNHVRLYHYINDIPTNPDPDEGRHQAAIMLKTRGLDIAKAKGSNYGEPNVVWASVHMPDKGKVFAEFSVDVHDPRFAYPWGKGTAPRGDCYFTDSIQPQEILAIHEPWHRHYRYLVKNNLIDACKNGEYDYVLNTPEYAPAVIKAKS